MAPVPAWGPGVSEPAVHNAVAAASPPSPIVRRAPPAHLQRPRASGAPSSAPAPATIAGGMAMSVGLGGSGDAAPPLVAGGVPASAPVVPPARPRRASRRGASGENSRGGPGRGRGRGAVLGPNPTIAEEEALNPFVG